MQVPSQQEIIKIVVLATAVFLLAPAFLLLYINSYNRRKKLHIEEKDNMKLQFESELLKTQIEVQEQTMQTIAADLHDNIGQLLSLTNLTLSSVNINETEKAQQKIKSSQELLAKSIKEMRQLAKLMHGEQLIEMGLYESFRNELDYLSKSGTYKISFESNCDGLKTASKEKDLILFRLLQESLNNIIKHSAAENISVALNLDNRNLKLVISDDGKGFMATTSTEPKGLGLSNLKKRTLLIGGEAQFHSSPGKGTTISITVPYT